VIEYYNNLFKAMFNQMNLIPGSREFIRKAHKKGFKLGLTTSALQENQQRIFELFNLRPFFSAVITSQDIINGKPHPEPYLKTAEKLGVAPTNALVIGGFSERRSFWKSSGMSGHCDYDLVSPSATDGVAGGLRGRFLCGIGAIARF
jgi:hypothetical protein